MQKKRMQLQIVVGIFLLISALTGERQASSLTSQLPSISLVSTHKAKAAAFQPQSAKLISASPIISCPACHGSIAATGQNTAAGETIQFIRLQAHSAPIVQCAYCHTEPSLKAFSGLPDYD